MAMPPYECDKDETVEDPSRALHSNALNALDPLNMLDALDARRLTLTSARASHRNRCESQSVINSTTSVRIITGAGSFA